MCVSHGFTVTLSGIVGGSGFYLYVFSTINFNLYQDNQKFEYLRNITILIVPQAKAQHDFKKEKSRPIYKTQSSFSGVLSFPICSKNLFILL